MMEQMIDINTEYTSSEEIREIQNRQLRSLIERTWNQVPFYRRLWKKSGVGIKSIQGLEDLEKLPLINKKDILDSIEEYPPFGDFQGKFESIRVQASTGSTGKPKPIFQTRLDWENIATLWARRLRAQGVKPKDIVQIAFAYSLFIVGFTSTEGAMKLGATVVPTGSGAVTASERQLEIARNWRVNVLGCTGSYALRLAEVAEKMGLNTRRDFQIRIMFHAAEPLTQSMREEIEARWNCKSFDNYGSVEIGAPTFECLHQQGMHVNEDAYIFEIIDPKTLNPVPLGDEGELVVTTLVKEAAPFIRYRIRDVTSFIPAPCLCGRNLKRIKSIKGRTDEMIKIKGVSAYPTDFEVAVKNFNIFSPEYLIVVDRADYVDKVRLMVEYLGPSDRSKEYREYLKKEVRKIVGINVEVELCGHGVLKEKLKTESRIKYKRLLDLR
jgi:phenylacetate-CoA ligase